jgi:hypothetical protein
MSSIQSLTTINDIDSGYIFVENIRSLYNIPRVEARTLCEMAVRDGVFIKRIGLICPAPTCDKRIIADFSSYDEIPEEITCHICEAQDVEPSTYKTNALQKVEFYQLKKDE